MESLIKEKSLQHDEKSSNEVSKANALESLIKDLKIEDVGEAIDDEFSQVIINLLTKGMQGKKAKSADISHKRPNRRFSCYGQNALVS